MPRISKEKAEKFMSMARHMADTFSKDKEKKVGCVLLDPKTLFVRACGYNGVPLGVCDSEARWERANKAMYVTHAELNCICSAARNGAALDDSICVCTYHPCSGCARALIQAGITCVVTCAPDFLHPRWGQEFKIADELFSEAGVEMMYI